METRLSSLSITHEELLAGGHRHPAVISLKTRELRLDGTVTAIKGDIYFRWRAPTDSQKRIRR